MIRSMLGRKGYGHTIELQRQTSRCMFGTSTPCMTCRHMGFLLLVCSREVPMLAHASGDEEVQEEQEQVEEEALGPEVWL